MGSELPEDELRRRYLDWCSARVARRFLELTHEEVWLRSRMAESLRRPSDLPRNSADSPSSSEDVPDFLDLVRRTAVLLASEMNLPTFEEWKEFGGGDRDGLDGEMPG